MSSGWVRGAAAVIAIAAALVACGGDDDDGVGSGPPKMTLPPDPVVLGAGDIADCNSTGDEATAALLAEQPGATVVALGDNAYNSGTADEFANCYTPSWGAAKKRTRPTPGNHEYETPDAAPYFAYFGRRAGEPSKGYYSYDLGSWHLVALNSNCSVVSCKAGDPQEQWLRDDLASHEAKCVVAYWHHPRFSSGTRHGSSTDVAPLFQALYDADADLVLAGHEHNYERFAPLDPSGKVDEQRGIRTFVVGTGGRSHYELGAPLPGSEARNADTFGVIELTLHKGSYSWQFLPAAGGTFEDRGSAKCH